MLKKHLAGSTFKGHSYNWSRNCLLVKTYKNNLRYMKFFYLASNPNLEGQFIVHDRDCPNIPSTYDRDYLGAFNSALEALRSASFKKPNMNICQKCGCKKEIYSIKA